MYDQKQAGVNDFSEIVMWQLLYRVPDTLNAALQKYTMNQFSSRKKRANF